MSFNTALTSGQYDSLRGTALVSPSHRAALYLSLCPNDVVFSARINQAVFGKSTVAITYDGGSGVLADVRPGQTLLISHVDDPREAFFSGRIRKTPAAPTLYCNETSAPLADNDYIFVLNDYRVWDKLPRATANIEYPDYEVSFRQLLPRIWSLKSDYVVMVDTGDAGSFEFAPSVAASTDGATISSYLWEVADGTITVGSDTDQNVTVEFPAGFRWVHLTVTDSGGRVSTRHFPVWVHDDTYPPTLLDHGDLEVTASLDEGYHASVTAFAGLSDILDNTLICAWLDGERYNETLTTIVDNIAMLGRLRTESSQTSYQDAQQQAETRFEIEGPLQQLARLEVTSQEIDDKASPTRFNQVKTLTLWREIILILTEYSTFHELHSLDFDDTSNTYREKAIATQAGSLLAVVNALANGIGAAIQMNSAGEAEVVRAGVMLPTDDRDALVTVADWTDEDILGLTLNHDHVLVVGRLDASGGSYKSSNGKVTVAISLAPGMAPDYPDANQRLDNQILAADLSLADAETELNERAGHALAKAQGADELTIQHPDGYWWLTPAADQWYTFTLDGSETARGVVLDDSIRWQLVSTTITHEIATGTRAVEAVYRRETAGAPGQAIRVPPQSNAPLTLPSFPPLDGFPAFSNGDFYLGDTTSPATLAGSLAANVRHDGNTVLVWTTRGVWIANDCLTQLTPTWIEITPPLEDNEIITQCCFIPGDIPGCYVLTSGGWSESIDFRTSDGGFVPEVVLVADRANYVAGVGWRAVDSEDGTYRVCNLVGNFSPTTYMQLSYVYDADNGDTSSGALRTIGVPYGTQRTNDGGAEGSGLTLAWAGMAESPQIGIGGTTGISGSPTGDITIVSFKAEGLGDNPFSGDPSGEGHLWSKTNAFDSGEDWASNALPVGASELLRLGSSSLDVYLYTPSGADVYYSSDGGATWSTAIHVGDSPATIGGFDTQRLGTVTLAAADGEVLIATTAGGSYASYTAYGDDAEPAVLFIPRYKFDGTNNGIGVSDPDFLTASETSDVAGHSVWTVDTGGTVINNITPLDGGGHHGFATGPNCLVVPWYSGAYHDFLAVLKFDNDPKLAVSLDGGATWEVSGALDGSASFITTRRTDLLRKQLWIANGPNIAYCNDYKVSPLLISTRIGPSGDTVLGIDVLP